MKILYIPLLLFVSNLYSGGKFVVEPESPVVPILEPVVIYVGVGIDAAMLSGCNVDNCDYEDVTYGGMLRAGYDYNEYVGIEARYWRTFMAVGPFGGAPLEHLGLFLKPQYHITEDFNLYGLLGYGYTKNLGNGNRLRYFDSDVGLSGGAGLEYDLSDKSDLDYEKDWTIFLDYQRFLIKSDVPDLQGVSGGIRYDFN